MKTNETIEILVVDDNLENLQAAKEAFKNKAVYISKAEEAIEILKKQQFSYVLTDLVMPTFSEYDENRLDEQISKRKEDLGEFWNNADESLWKRVKESGYRDSGAYIAKEAIKKGIPVAIISYLGHHSDFEWASHLLEDEFKIEWSCGGFNPKKQIAYITDETFNKARNLGYNHIKNFKKDPEHWSKSLELLKQSMERKEKITYYGNEMCNILR